MPLAQKASIGGLFCLGWICIAVAIVRVRELGGTTSSNSAPNPTWLALWGTIETSIGKRIRLYSSWDECVGSLTWIMFLQL